MLSLIREYRIKMAEKGINQKELAEKSYVNAATVSQFLTGKKDTQLSVLKALAEGLDCELTIKDKEIIK